LESGKEKQKKKLSIGTRSVINVKNLIILGIKKKGENKK